MNSGVFLLTFQSLSIPRGVASVRAVIIRREAVWNAAPRWWYCACVTRHCFSFWIQSWKGVPGHFQRVDGHRYVSSNTAFRFRYLWSDNLHPTSKRPRGWDSRPPLRSSDCTKLCFEKYLELLYGIFVFFCETSSLNVTCCTLFGQILRQVTPVLNLLLGSKQWGRCFSSVTVVCPTALPKFSLILATLCTLNSLLHFVCVLCWRQYSCSDLMTELQGHWLSESSEVDRAERLLCVSSESWFGCGICVFMLGWYKWKVLFPTYFLVFEYT